MPKNSHLSKAAEVVFLMKKYPIIFLRCIKFMVHKTFNATPNITKYSCVLKKA